jgi:phage shock protein C
VFPDGSHGAGRDSGAMSIDTLKLRRNPDDRLVAGVCGGIARTFGMDAALVRILLVAATLLGFGAGAVLYVIAWLVVPEE